MGESGKLNPLQEGFVILFDQRMRCFRHEGEVDPLQVPDGTTLDFRGIEVKGVPRKSSCMLRHVLLTRRGTTLVTQDGHGGIHVHLSNLARLAEPLEVEVVQFPPGA